MISSMAGTVCRCLQRYSVISHHPAVGMLTLSAHNKKSFSTQPANDVIAASEISPKPDKMKDKKMSSAMKMYLNRKREHDSFIAREEADFELGKEHLANIMGMDKHFMTQEDIDKSIEYLFPSGLIPEARPLMKPPAEIYPRQKDAEFDAAGRPNQPFFYTLKPNLYDSIYKLRDSMEAVTIFGERLQKQGKRPDSDQVLDVGKLADTRWVTKEELSDIFVENINDKEHAEFITVLERLLELPFSYRVTEEIFKYRVRESSLVSEQVFIEPRYDQDGRAFVEFEGRRKTSKALVRVTKPGSGELAITNNMFPHYVMDIGYFFALKDRLQIMYPLQFTKMLGLVDVDIKVEGSGPSAQAGAIRYALSMCIRSFVDKGMVDDMKIMGLLTQDIRTRERKRFGRVKARKGYTWKRR